MNRQIRRLFSGVVLIMAMVAGLADLRTRVLAGQAVMASGNTAPDFTLIDSNGSPVRLSAYIGKVVLLDFWATWCTGCKVEIPWYMEFQEKYQDRGLVSIGVAMDGEGWPLVKPYLAQHPINYPIVVGNADIAKSYGVASLPVTLLIDRRGRIADAHAGIVIKDAWEKAIRKLLAEPLE